MELTAAQLACANAVVDVHFGVGHAFFLGWAYRCHYPPLYARTGRHGNHCGAEKGCIMHDPVRSTTRDSRMCGRKHDTFELFHSVVRS
ncbi:hypothetical protein FKM82_023359 [Ascaphus truei]